MQEIFLHFFFIMQKKFNAVFLIGNAKNANFSSKKTCHKNFSFLITLTDNIIHCFSDIFEQHKTKN